MYKMRDNIYWNDSSGMISVINLSTAGGATLNAVWKQRKDKWYVVEPGSEKNVIDVLTPRQFHEAIENGKYSLKW
jgi:hypothetical protein